MRWRRVGVSLQRWADAPPMSEGLVDFCKIAGLSVIVMPLAALFVRAGHCSGVSRSATPSCWATPAIEGVRGGFTDTWDSRAASSSF